MDGAQVALRRGLCGLSEGLSCSEEGAYIVPGREALGCGWPWGDGGVLLSRGEVRGNVLEGKACVCLWRVGVQTGVPVVLPLGTGGACCVEGVCGKVV